MRTNLIVNDKSITTNYTNNKNGYSLTDGNDKKGYEMELQEFRETASEMLKRLAVKYTIIIFAETLTAIRWYHHLIAYCKT